MSESKQSAADPFFSGRKHFPELDGLRGIAILMVMAYHYSGVFPARSWLRFPASQGWAGVDLFFVLSGFLITGILYDSKGQQNFFRNFYARRFLRIFPLYYGFLFALLLALILLRVTSPETFYLHPDRVTLWRAQPWLWAYLTNMWPYHHSLTFVKHFWTLAIEEQFYVIWPLIIFRFPLRNLLRICFGVFVGSLALRLVITFFAAGNFGLVYNPMPCRADEFAAGAFVALILRAPTLNTRIAKMWCRSLLAGSGGLLAIALLATAAFGFHWRGFASGGGGSPWLGDFCYSALAVFFASTILYLATPAPQSGLPKYCFRISPLRSMGKYSYALYVFHWPLFYLLISLRGHLRSGASLRSGIIADFIFIGINFVGAFALAFTSYHLYEKHFLKLKKYFPERVTAAATKNGQRDTAL